MMRKSIVVLSSNATKDLKSDGYDAREHCSFVVSSASKVGDGSERNRLCEDSWLKNKSS